MRRNTNFKRRLQVSPLIPPQTPRGFWKAMLARLFVRKIFCLNSDLQPDSHCISGFDPAIPGVYRKTTEQYSLGALALAPGCRVYCNLSAINEDPRTFPSPKDIVPTRPTMSYRLLQGDGVLRILGEEFVYGTAASVLRAIFSLKNVRRASGPTGTLRRYVLLYSLPLHFLKGTIFTLP